MKEFFCSLAMAVVFWIPATAAIFAIASAIPLKSFRVAFAGVIGLLVSLLIRMLIKKIAQDRGPACESDHTDRIG